VGGVASPESNARFDTSLRSQDASWGLRDLEAIQALAEGSGFAAPEVTELPANNKMLAFRKL
jgi:hypothetical protein